VSGWLLLLSVLLAPGFGLQVQPDASADPTFHAVSYVEVGATSTRTAIDALRRYRDVNRQRDGFISIEIFEQIGRPGHFVVLEAWRDQKAFDAKDPAAQKQLLTTLEPIRVSGYDERPYKTLSTARGAGKPDRDAVYVISHVDIAPTSPIKAPEALRSQAEASRKEPGNLRFDVVQHTMRGNHFTVVEGWQNQKALDAHVATAHTRQYRDTIQPGTGSPLDERVFKAID
jgi:autoinducer 2-degrading protein